MKRFIRFITSQLTRLSFVGERNGSHAKPITSQLRKTTVLADAHAPIYLGCFIDQVLPVSHGCSSPTDSYIAAWYAPSNKNVLKSESSSDSYAISSTSSCTNPTSLSSTSRKSANSSASTISLASSHTYVNDGLEHCAEVVVWDRNHKIAAPHVLHYLADHKQLDLQQYAEFEKDCCNGVYLDDAVSTVTLVWINVDVARRIAGIEQMCDYVFRDKSLCLEAITPATWCRPAVLGDSVQKTILADQWKRATSLECTNQLWTEELANKVLRNTTLGRRGTALNLLHFAYLGLYPNDDKQMQKVIKEQQGNKAGKEDDVASMVEAIFGAVYQDSGSDWRPVFKVMLNLGVHLTGPESTHAGVRATIDQTLLQEHLELAGCATGGISRDCC